MNRNRIVTLDGYCASGKSTLAKKFSELHQLPLMSTGEAHRINATIIYESGVDLSNKAEVLAYLCALKLDWIIDNNVIHFKINSRMYTDIDNESEIIRNYMPVVTRVPEICSYFTYFFRSLKSAKVIVCEGHGVGNGIFPQAMLKFFCAAPIDVRVERRCRQQNKNNLAAVFQEITLRDESDKKREINAVAKTDDMIEIDTFKNTVDQCIMVMTEKYKECNDGKYYQLC